MCKNIIFDIGNVLLDFKPQIYLKQKIGEDKVEEVLKEVFKSEEWLMLDRGTILEEDAIELITSRSNGNGELVKLAFDNWYDILKPIYSTVDILRKLKAAGYKVYYLSNFHLKAFEYVTKEYEFFNIFDGGVVSYEEKLMKPEKEIYIKIIDKYNLDSEETIFVDDMLENVIKASEVNMKTVLFESPENLLEVLVSYGINL